MSTLPQKIIIETENPKMLPTIKDSFVGCLKYKNMVEIDVTIKFAIKDLFPASLILNTNPALGCTQKKGIKIRNTKNNKNRSVPSLKPTNPRIDSKLNSP